MYVARYVAGLCLARAMTATTGAEKAGNDLMNTNLLGLFVWGEAQEEWRPPLQQPLASSHPSSLPPLLQFKFSAKIGPYLLYSLRARIHHPQRLQS